MSSEIMIIRNSESQLTDTILMIRPVRFGFNPQTAKSNTFQNPDPHSANELIQQSALKEFEGLKSLLTDAGIEVIVFDDTTDPHTPDSIFPNNWFTSHADGRLVLYPMETENRREERRMDIIERLAEMFDYSSLEMLSQFEKKGKHLEGTGSMVLDRVDRIVYMCLSSRAHPDVVREFARRMNYNCVVMFDATVRGHKGEAQDLHWPIYHTNVAMSVGESAAVVCTEVIRNAKQREEVLASLVESKKEIIDLTMHQLHEFAGNMLQVKNTKGEKFWVMSNRAHDSLTNLQKKILRKDSSQILHSPLPTIERLGGGSARCMLAEIHKPL